MPLQYIAASAAFNATPGQAVVVDTSGGNIAGTMSHPYGFAGQEIAIINNGVNSVTLTINGSGGAFTGGGSTFPVPPLTTQRFFSNGGYTTAGVWQAMAGISGLQVAYAKYSFAVDAGAQGTITPIVNTLIPDNAIIVGGSVNSTTAVTSLGSATVGVGTSAGSSTTSILAATAKATLSADARLNAVPVFATPVKLTAAGFITFTIAVSDLTAGVIEVFLIYFVPSA